MCRSLQSLHSLNAFIGKNLGLPKLLIFCNSKNPNSLTNANKLSGCLSLKVITHENKKTSQQPKIIKSATVFCSQPLNNCTEKRALRKYRRNIIFSTTKNAKICLILHKQSKIDIKNEIFLRKNLLKLVSYI